MKARLTVVETVYHEAGDGAGPTSAESLYTRFLETTEQTYRRRMTVGEEWVPLDLGWLHGEKGQPHGVGLLTLVNTTRWNGPGNPTEEQITAVREAVVEVGYRAHESYSDLLWFIPPGESMRGLPSNPRCLMVRCRKGKAVLEIAAWPR